MPAIEREKIAIRGNNSRTEALNNGLFVSACVFSGLNHRHFLCSFSFAPFHFPLTLDISFTLAQDLSAGYVYQCNCESTQTHIQTQTYGIFGHKDTMLSVCMAAIAIVSIIAGKSLQCLQNEKRENAHTFSLVSGVLLWFVLSVCFIHGK